MAGVSRYLQVTSTGAFVAFILYLYIEIATTTAVGAVWKNVFLVLFLVFSILAVIDALRGGLKDKRIVGKVSVGKRVIRK